MIGGDHVNNNKRDKLREAVSIMRNAVDIIRDVLDDESCCLSSMPENLETSSRYESIESAVDYLEDAVSDADSAIESVEEAIAQ